MNKLIISLAAAILSLPVAADEGMWLLPLLKGQRFPEMQALGLKLQDYDIYSPDSASLKDAVVIFGGGCTGEIVSPEGLLLTNHHCGYGCIQRHSTLEHDYLTDGFWAMSRDQELPNPGMTVTFIDKIEDVTDYVKKELEKDTDPNSMNFLSPKFLNGLAKAKVGEKFLQDNLNPAKRKAMAVKNEKRFLKQKRNALKNPGYSHHPVKTQASFKRLLKAV